MLLEMCVCVCVENRGIGNWEMSGRLSFWDLEGVFIDFLGGAVCCVGKGGRLRRAERVMWCVMVRW